MDFQYIWNKFINLFKCFIPYRKPEYLTCPDYDSDNEYGELKDFDTPNYNFIIRA